MLEIQKERLYLHAPSACIQMEITFQSPVSRQALTEAIMRASARYPVLSSVVSTDENGRACWIPGEIASPKVADLGPVEDLAEVIRQNNQTPFAIERGEWMRNALCQIDGKSVWLLAMHHAAGDGRSMLFFIRDVQRALADPALTFSPEPTRLCDPGALPGKVAFPLRWMVGRMNHKWAREKRVFTPQDRERMTAQYWKNHSIHAACAQVGREDLDRILAACKSRQTTLTAAWIAAMQAGGIATGDVAVAADIRPEDFEGMANWAAGITVRRQGENRGFWDNAREIKAQMNQTLQSADRRNFLLHFLNLFSPTLLDAAYYSAFGDLDSKPAAAASRLLGFSVPPKGNSLTNLLRAPTDDSVIAGIRFYPPMPVNARRLFGLITANQTLQITCQAEAPAEEIARQLQDILNALLSQVKS